MPFDLVCTIPRWAARHADRQQLLSCEVAILVDAHGHARYETRLSVGTERLFEQAHSTREGADKQAAELAAESVADGWKLDSAQHAG